jgi:hypothetical protein
MENNEVYSTEEEFPLDGDMTVDWNDPELAEKIGDLRSGQILIPERPGNYAVEQASNLVFAIDDPENQDFFDLKEELEVVPSEIVEWRWEQVFYPLEYRLLDYRRDHPIHYWLIIMGEEEDGLNPPPGLVTTVNNIFQWESHLDIEKRTFIGDRWDLSYFRGILLIIQSCFNYYFKSIRL